VVALGIDGDGVKHPLALAEGSTENATLVRDLLVGLRERGLDVTRPLLVVIDGSRALARAVRDVFDQPVLQRCQLHYADLRIMPTSGLCRHGRGIPVAGHELLVDKVGIIRAVATSMIRYCRGHPQAAWTENYLRADLAVAERPGQDHMCTSIRSVSLCRYFTPDTIHHVGKAQDYADLASAEQVSHQRLPIRGRHNQKIGIMHLMPISA
jgi:hypothetical protein